MTNLDKSPPRRENRRELENSFHARQADQTIQQLAGFGWMTDLRIEDILQDFDLLLELEPEELGGCILAYANTTSFSKREEILYKGFRHLLDLGNVPVGIREDVILALSEAWQWLEREGLVTPKVHSHGFTITRRGQRLRSSADAAAYVASRSLPRNLLHPRLVQRVWSAVVRGDYETAIFQSFREVEISVREASALPSTEIGVALVRKAFDKNSGPLTLADEPEAEREALAHLFAGAIGRFKNPTGHRSVEYTLSDAAEALTLASMLLRIIDQRLKVHGASADQEALPSKPAGAIMGSSSSMDR